MARTFSWFFFSLREINLRNSKKHFVSDFSPSLLCRESLERLAGPSLGK